VTLENGSRLGPYEIVGPLGAGGMGEVYKAKDTRLDRTVAIKVLPSHLSHDSDLRQRFEREARAVSSLNHPHICTLYDVGEQDGVDFLVMEYIEGETLADRLKKGPLPLDVALGYAIQIADALDKAHRAGVVHRDFKPGNIMITKPGVKLTDFGLAKMRTSAREDQALSALPTEEKPLTEKGVILGTFQYMAPEQLEGKEADARTDIFAFGAVLYEMVTGKRAFEGKSQASLITAIMSAEPPAISSLQPMTPPALDHVVKTCLAKDPDRRWQSAGDVARQLEWTTESGARADVSSVGGGTRHSLLLIGLLLVGALVGAIAWNFLQPSSPASNPVTRLVVTLPPEQQSSASSAPVLSPNGRYLVFVGANELYLRSMEQFEASPIPGTEHGRHPFFSPDSRWIGFFAKGALNKVLAAGGAPITICRAPNWVSGASWGPDDTIVISASESGLMRVSVDGSALEEFTRREKGELRQSTPQILPDGKSVLFTIVREEGSSIGVASLETGEYRSLFEGSAPRYLPTGHLVYVQSGSLLAVSFDLASLETTGPPAPVLDGVYTFLADGLEIGLYTISDTGSLAYAPGGQVISRRRDRLVWVGRDGRPQPLTEQKGDYRIPRISPDGKQVAVSRQTEEGSNIWFYDVERGTSMRFTFEGSQYESCWTPNGDRLAFTSFHTPQGIYWKPVDGSTPTEPLATSTDAESAPGSWSPDGAVLAYQAWRSVANSDIWILPRESGDESFPFANTAFNEVAPVFSPDGRFIAYVSDETGQNEVYVQPYPGLGGKRLVSTNGGSEPVWSRDGRELFYRHGNDLLVVGTELEPELRLGQPRVLFQRALRPSVVGPANYDVSADGRRLIMVELGEGDAPTQLNVILNWSQELERLVPTKE
jgi:serine/threonine protein kinase